MGEGYDDDEEDDAVDVGGGWGGAAAGAEDDAHSNTADDEPKGFQVQENGFQADASGPAGVTSAAW